MVIRYRWVVVCGGGIVGQRRGLGGDVRWDRLGTVSVGEDDGLRLRRGWNGESCGGETLR